MNQFDQAQWRKPFIWITFGVLIIGIVPFLIGRLVAPPDKLFSGALINPDDISVYLSAIRQGMAGEWLFSFTFSPESIQDRFTYPLYIILGHLIRIFGGDPVIWYHGFRIFSGIFTIMALFYWAKVVFSGNKKTQMTILFLLAFGSGLGWALSPIIPVDSLLLADINVPEWNLVTSLLSSPHFVLGIGLEALFISTLVQMEQSDDWKKLIVLGFISAIGIGLDFPFHIPTLGLVIGIYLIWLAIRDKKIPWRKWLSSLLIMTPLILYLVYYGIAALTDPSWAESHINNNLIEPPPPLGLFIGSGLLGLFAILGIKEWFRQKRPLLIPIWAIVNALIIYFPVPFSGRFILGLFIPITTLAAFSIDEVILPKLKASTFYSGFSKLTPTPYESLRRGFIILTLPTTLLITLWVIRNTITTRDFPNYYPFEEIQASEWLAENSDEKDLILAYYPMGNYLPRNISGKVFLGHLNLTLDLDGKLDAIEIFWDANTTQEWREDFLEEWGISFIYQGKYENLLSATTVTPPGEVVYQNDSVSIFALPESSP